jgi:hypothetical protein
METNGVAYFEAASVVKKKKFLTYTDDKNVSKLIFMYSWCGQKIQIVSPV